MMFSFKDYLKKKNKKDFVSLDWIKEYFKYSKTKEARIRKLFEENFELKKENKSLKDGLIRALRVNFEIKNNVKLPLVEDE